MWATKLPPLNARALLVLRIFVTRRLLVRKILQGSVETVHTSARFVRARLRFALMFEAELASSENLPRDQKSTTMAAGGACPRVYSAIRNSRSP